MGKAARDCDAMSLPTRRRVHRRHCSFLDIISHDVTFMVIASATAQAPRRTVLAIRAREMLRHRTVTVACVGEVEGENSRSEWCMDMRYLR